MKITFKSNFDWWGTDEELKKAEEHIKKTCAAFEGVDYHGLWVPHNQKYHYVRVWTGEDWHKFWQWERLPRDKTKLSHVVFEYMTEAQL